MKQNKDGILWSLIIILLAVFCILLLWRAPDSVLEKNLPSPTVTGEPPQIEHKLPTEKPPVVEDDGLPHDKLFITVERQRYKDGDLTLLIPTLEVNAPVLNGVDSSTLNRGLGLYDYAQLPGEGNRNVSIAGHRNGLRNGNITDTVPFYYLDTLSEGDYLYLVDSQHIYRYLYHDTEIVEANDWGPIYSQGYSCLTLTSCHPIGIADHRIIVRGELDQIFNNLDNFDYLANQFE